MADVSGSGDGRVEKKPPESEATAIRPKEDAHARCAAKSRVTKKGREFGPAEYCPVSSDECGMKWVPSQSKPSLFKLERPILTSGNPLRRFSVVPVDGLELREVALRRFSNRRRIGLSESAPRDLRKNGILLSSSLAHVLPPFSQG